MGVLNDSGIDEEGFVEVVCVFDVHASSFLNIKRFHDSDEEMVSYDRDGSGRTIVTRYDRTIGCRFLMYFGKGVEFRDDEGWKRVSVCIRMCHDEKS